MDHSKNTILIAAVTKDYSIGKDGHLLIRIPEDMKFFRDTTIDNIVVMGRKTYESIGKALPKRINIVLTRNKDYKLDDAIVIHNKEELYSLLELEEYKNKKVFIIGGEQIYKLFYKEAKYIILTEIKSDLSGDAKFPIFKSLFRLIESSLVKTDEKSGLEYVRSTYKHLFFGNINK